MALETKLRLTRLVHDFFIVPGSKFSLVGKENPPGRLVPVFTLVKLELDGIGRQQGSAVQALLKICVRKLPSLTDFCQDKDERGIIAFLEHLVFSSVKSKILD